MITLSLLYDAAARTTAIGLTGADFCFEGDHPPLVLPLSDNDLTQWTISNALTELAAKRSCGTKLHSDAGSNIAENSRWAIGCSTPPTLASPKLELKTLPS